MLDTQGDGDSEVDGRQRRGWGQVMVPQEGRLSWVGGTGKAASGHHRHHRERWTGNSLKLR